MTIFFIILAALLILDIAAVKGVIGDCGFSSGYDELKLHLREMFRLPAFPIMPTTNLITRAVAGYSLRERTAI